MAVGNAMVNTARFKPLSYDEWAAPLKGISSQHAAAEKALDDVSSDAAQYERYIMGNPNSAEAIQYRNFLNDIERQTEALLQSGITPQSRADIINLKREYNRSIKPIKTGIALYQKAAEKRAKDAQKGIIGPDITPEDFIYNPNYEDTYLLGTNIYTDVKNLFKNLTGFDNKPKQYNNGTSIITEMPQGYSSEEIQTLFADEENPSLTQELKDTWKLIKNKYGFNTLTPEQQEQFIYYALQGALSGTKPPKYTTRNIPKQKETTSTSNQSGRTSIGDDAEGLD